MDRITYKFKSSSCIWLLSKVFFVPWIVMVLWGVLAAHHGWATYGYWDFVIVVFIISMATNQLDVTYFTGYIKRG